MNPEGRLNVLRAQNYDLEQQIAEISSALDNVNFTEKGKISRLERELNSLYKKQDNVQAGIDDLESTNPELAELNLAGKRAQVGLSQLQLERAQQAGGAGGVSPNTRYSQEQATSRTAMTQAGETARHAASLMESSRHNQATELLEGLARAIALGQLDEEKARNKFLSYLDLRKQALDEFSAGVGAYSNLAKYAVPEGTTQYPGTEAGGVISRVTGSPGGQFPISPQPVDVGGMMNQALSRTPMPAPM